MSVHESQTVHLNESSFDGQVGAEGATVLVDFWAPWCPPCRALGPTIDRLATDFAGRAIVAKVNVDESPALAQRFGVQSIPTMLIFKNGEVVDQMIGLASPGAIAERLERAIGE